MAPTMSLVSDYRYNMAFSSWRERVQQITP
jgi:hypothetical protein